MITIKEHIINNNKKKPIYKQHFKWNANEDELLKILVQQNGEDNWRFIARHMNGRSSRQCRERWRYYLNPNLKKNNWTVDEDQLIIEKYNLLGPKWKMIECFLENRTDAMIKNRFHVLARQVKKGEQKDSYENKEEVNSDISNIIDQLDFSDFYLNSHFEDNLGVQLDDQFFDSFSEYENISIN